MVSMTEQQTALRGKEAAQILDSEVFKDAMNSLKSQVMEQWKQAPIRDREGQVLLLQLAKLADKFEAILVGLVEQGKFAERKIELDSLRDESTARRFARRVVG